MFDVTLKESIGNFPHSEHMANKMPDFWKPPKTKKARLCQDIVDVASIMPFELSSARYLDEFEVVVEDMVGFDKANHSLLLLMPTNVGELYAWNDRTGIATGIIVAAVCRALGAPEASVEPRWCWWVSKKYCEVNDGSLRA